MMTTYKEIGPGAELWFRHDLANVLSAMASLPMPASDAYAAGWLGALDAVGRLLALVRDDPPAPAVWIVDIQPRLERVVDAPALPAGDGW